MIVADIENNSRNPELLDRERILQDGKKYWALRRTQDVVLSVLALAALWPLMLLVALKIFLWMLPGTAVLLLALVAPVSMASLLMIVGFVGMLIPGIMAGYRYAMSVYVLADGPETKLRQCIRRSCEVMKHRKFELFSLEISFIGWSLLLSMVQSMLMGFGPVVGMTLGMFASLFLTVYTTCAQAAFYQEYAVGKVELPSPEDEPTDELT